MSIGVHPSQTAQAADEIKRQIDWLVRCADGGTAQFERCRKAANAFASVVYAFVEDSEGVGTDALREAWSAYMTQDSGNFASDPQPAHG